MPEPPAFERDNQTEDRELSRFVDVEVVASSMYGGPKREKAQKLQSLQDQVTYTS